VGSAIVRALPPVIGTTRRCWTSQHCTYATHFPSRETATAAGPFFTGSSDTCLAAPVARPVRVSNGTAMRYAFVSPARFGSVDR
jgi:hypothetical protein